MLRDNPQALIQMDTAQFGMFSSNIRQFHRAQQKLACPRQDMLHISDIQDN